MSNQERMCAEIEAELRQRGFTPLTDTRRTLMPVSPNSGNWIVQTGSGLFYNARCIYCGTEVNVFATNILNQINIYLQQP